MIYFAGENPIHISQQEFGEDVAEFKFGDVLKRGFVRTRSSVNDYKMVKNLTKVRTSPKSQFYKTKPKFQRTPLTAEDNKLKMYMTNVKYHKGNFNLFMGECAEFARKKKKEKESKLRPPRQVNPWDKAREIRSGIGTAQRVSQDIRGWLSYARALRG